MKKSFLHAGTGGPGIKGLARMDVRFWRLSARLWLGFGMMLALLMLITVMALLRMQRMADLSSEVVEQHNRRIAVAQIGPCR
jgi:CHASE3 domain sensor protein